MQKRKFKLVKEKKNIVLALILTSALILGGRSIYEKTNQSNNQYGLLSQEEIMQREAILNIENKKSNENNIDNFNTSVTPSELMMTITAVGAGGAIVYQKLKPKRVSTNNYRLILKPENNSVIGSKLKRSFTTYR